MENSKPTGSESLESSQLHPQHESWARITTRSSLTGAVILLGLIVLLVVVINLHFSTNAMAFLGVLGVVALVVFVLCTTPMRRRGFVGNAELTMRVKSELGTELGAGRVNVYSSKGVVTLRGNVPYVDFREQAQNIARRCGARKVVNNLSVIANNSTIEPDSYIARMPDVTTPEGAPEVSMRQPTAQSVREAMEDDNRVNAYLLIVEVEDGIAYLTGRQDTADAGDAATEIALSVPGILSVSNDIEIEPSV